MNILFICPRFPYPLLKGDQSVVFNRLRTLSPYHKIVLLTFYEEVNELDNLNILEKFCDKIYPVRLKKSASLINACKGLFLTSNPLQVSYYSSNEMRKILKFILKNNKFDIIHTFLLRMVEYVKKINDIPVILEAIDSMQLNVRRRLLIETGFKKYIFKEELKRLILYEKSVSHFVKHIIVVSDQDRMFFDTDCISVLPLGIDRSEFFVDKSISKQSDTIIFSGNMGYEPNINAVNWFIKECFSYIKLRNEKIKFIIAGSNVNEKIQKLHNDKDILVTGFVKSMGDVLRKSQVSIAPMQSGSGMQYKILEAMASGVPVVTNSLGLGDIKAENEVEIMVRNDPTSFADAVLRCLNDEKLRNKLSGAASNFIEKNHSWESGAEKINHIYTKCIDRKLKNFKGAK